MLQITILFLLERFSISSNFFSSSSTCTISAFFCKVCFTASISWFIPSKPADDSLVVVSSVVSFVKIVSWRLWLEASNLSIFFCKTFHQATQLRNVFRRHSRLNFKLLSWAQNTHTKNFEAILDTFRAERGTVRLTTSKPCPVPPLPPSTILASASSRPCKCA